MCWPFAFGYGLCSSYAIANWKDGTLLGSEKGMGKTQIFIFQWFLKAFPGNYALFEDNLYPSSLSPTKMRINFEGLLTRWCSFLSAVHQPHQYTVMHSWAYDWWHFMLISYSKSLIIILPLWLLSNPYGILHNFRFSLLSKIHQILFYQTCNVAMMHSSSKNLFTRKKCPNIWKCPKKEFLGWKTCQEDRESARVLV